MADYLGQQFGKYRLTRLLGTGGFAEVYLGEHIHLGTEAALKLLHTQLATEADVEKFRQEARTIASLIHPNIVRVLDFAVEGSTPYLVMDYAPNGSLRQHLPAGKPLAPAEFLPYLVQVADALQYAHDQKVVHRDIKPENMLLGRRGEVLLTDFGIATVAQSTTSQKTEGVAGTAAYMAPEQIQGKPRPSSDLYSLAVIVYEWLAGERPFQGTFTEVASQHLFAAPPPLRDKLPDLSPLIEQVVMTALAKDPKERFGSVRAFATALAQASGTDITVSSLSTRAALPASPAAAPINPPGITVSAASQLTPHVTPQLTPQGAPGGLPGIAVSAASHVPPAAVPPLGVPSAPNPQSNQVGPSVLYSPTQLLSPIVVTSLPPASAPAAPSVTGPRGGDIANSPTYLPPGWAAVPGAPGSTPANKWAEGETVASMIVPPAAPGAVLENKTHRRRRLALIVLAALLALASIGGGTVYALPLLLRAGSTPPPHSTSATVTITPQSSDLKNTYTITGVTSTPDASQHQVGARTVSATTQPVQQTVSATGTQTTPATYATGYLLFWTNYQVSYPAGSVFTGSDGVSVAIDYAVNLIQSSVTVSAHAVYAGSSGNITAGDINQGSNQVYSCPVGSALRADFMPQSGSTTVICNTQPFSGGANTSAASVVQQSDIDNAANSLIQANQPNAQQVVQSQLQPNERLAGTPQCQPTTSANHNAGDVANQVTVTVTFTCTGEAYDYDGALALATTLLKDQAASNPGSTYALAGQVKVTLISATPDSQGVVAIVVNAEGIWAYQFSAAQKQALANQIAGESKQGAQSFLSTQTGVAQVSIEISGGDGQKLPTNVNEITIKVKAVSGL